MNRTNGFHVSGISISLRDGDFDEADVWDVLQERKEITTKSAITTHRDSHSPSPRFISRYLSSATKMIPRSNYSDGNAKPAQQSAPVRIPDWSKIRHKSSKIGAENDNSTDGSGDSDDDIDYDDDEHGCRMAPHEIIARRAARSQISSFSVFEGAGRTLKGRDLEKVRNAVLTRTGFLE